MQYRSPFALLYLTGNFPASWDDSGLLRIQKQLLVELEHHGGGILRGGGKEWTKDDILKLISMLRQVEERKFHQWIYENPALLLLVEEGLVSEESPLYHPGLVADPNFESFQAFISPYLVDPVSRGLQQSLAQLDFAVARQFLEATTLLIPARAEEILAKLSPWLQALARMFRRVEAGDEPFDSQRLGYIITPEFIALLNALPASVADRREWLTVNLINLVVKIGTTDIAFSHRTYKCLLDLHCAPDIRRALIFNYSNFKAQMPTVVARKVYHDVGRRFAWTVTRVLGVFIGLCILVFGLMTVFHIDLPASGASASVLRGTEETVTEVQHTYYVYRDRLQTIVQKQMTPAGADSMRYIVLTNPQVNHVQTLWHHAVPGMPLSNYKNNSGRRLMIVNRSRYDAMLFVMGDSALYNGFLAQGDSVQIVPGLRDKLAFYVGNSWRSPGNMKRGVYPWTDAKAQYGIFTTVDSTTRGQLDKIYHLSPAAAATRLRVLLTTDYGGLRLVPGNVLVQDASQKERLEKVLLDVIKRD
jgi:hypothetical protein